LLAVPDRISTFRKTGVTAKLLRGFSSAQEGACSLPSVWKLIPTHIAEGGDENNTDVVTVTLDKWVN